MSWTVYGYDDDEDWHESDDMPSLAELIVEEKAAWDRQAAAQHSADIAEADEAADAANAATDCVEEWVPDNLADAIRLLEFGTRDDGLPVPPILAKSVLAGLRNIAAATAEEARLNPGAGRE
jgi:hypothetical protein